MAEAVRVSEGFYIDYTPTSNVSAGQVVVQGQLIGVAVTDIAANEKGALAVTGIFDFAKASGVNITAGAVVYWDDTNNVATTTSTGNVLLGKAVHGAGSTDTTVRVLKTN